MKTMGSITSRIIRGSLRPAAGLMLSLTLAVSLVSIQASQPSWAGPKGVTTMNANIYIGASTEPILSLDPSDPQYLAKLVAAVTQVYYQIVASQPDIRIQALADEIAARQPELVAVEEASLICLQSPGDLVLGGRTPATNVVYNYLKILLDALAARGAHYAVASVSEEWDVELPMMNMQTQVFEDVRQTDRNVILVRTDLPPGQLRVDHPQSGLFTNALTFPTLGLSVWRGWCSVEVTVRGEHFRYICAHLEEETSPEVQLGQAMELVAGPVNVPTPVILSGDFNADPLQRTGVPTFEVFAAAGLQDAWGDLYSSTPEGGLTWGHDSMLADPGIPFIWRLDLVLYRGGGITPLDSNVLDIGLDRTEPPLWASDHAMLTADFAFGKVKPESAAKAHK